MKTVNDFVEHRIELDPYVITLFLLREAKKKSYQTSGYGYAETVSCQ